MSNLDLNDFIDHLTPFLNLKGVEISNHPKVEILIDAMRSSANTFEGVASNLICYYQDISVYNEKAVEKFIGTSTEILSDLKGALVNLETWTEANLDELLVKYRNQKELSVPKINQPIRIALTGSTNSPSLGMTMFLFKKDEVIKRIDNLIKFVQPGS
jgi:glutamyl-tRNA synthetase